MNFTRFRARDFDGTSRIHKPARELRPPRPSHVGSSRSGKQAEVCSVPAPATAPP